MMTIEEIAKELDADFSLMTKSEIEDFKQTFTDASSLSGFAKSTLKACYLKGPLEDGDVPSKSGRDELLDKNFVAKVIVNGEDGYNACTYKGQAALWMITKSKEKMLTSKF